MKETFQPHSMKISVVFAALTAKGQQILNAPRKRKKYQQAMFLELYPSTVKILGSFCCITESDGYELARLNNDIEDNGSQDSFCYRRFNVWRRLLDTPDYWCY